MFSLCRQKRGILILNIILLLGLIILTAAIHRIENRQYSQDEAKRWSDGTIPYHQVSVFMQNDAAKDEAFLSEVRNSIRSSLNDAAYSDASVSGRLWIDAYMAESQDTVSKVSDMGQSSVEHVPIIGAGGDFFTFHPLEMLSGSTFTEDDINADRVVIEEQLAWALYGANDIAGKTVFISGKQFVIAGVYRAATTKEDKAARESAYLYMDFEAFQTLYDNKGMTCYEAVLPNPVKGFALKALKTAMGEEEQEIYDSAEENTSFGEIIYVDNTERFQSKRLYSMLFKLPKLVMRTNAVACPYWENAARMVEVQMSFMIWLRLLLLLCMLFFDRRAIWRVVQKVYVTVRKLPKLLRKYRFNQYFPKKNSDL